MRYLVLGSVNIDRTFSVDHIVNPGETIPSYGIADSAGGKGANQAAALGKAGLSVYFAGKLGSDGKWILDQLEEYGVNISKCIISPVSHTGQAIIQVDRSGQNSIILDAGGNMELDLAELNGILKDFQQGDMIILQNEINSIAEIIRMAKAKGMRICMNPSPFDERISDYPLDLVDIFFVNEIEGRLMAGMDTIPCSDYEFRLLAHKLISKFPTAVFILTAGKNGAYYISSEKGLFYSPIIDYPVVDTTGAGDTFCGYMLASLESGTEPEEALIIASRASGIAVSRKGAMASIPTKDEVFGE